MARRSDNFQVLPTEKVPFGFTRDLWMRGEPALVPTNDEGLEAESRSRAYGLK